MKTVQKGFTLIELMIVIAIIGILAAVAIPAYQNYTVRAQVTEGLALAASYKTAIEEFYTVNDAWPAGVTTNGSATTIAMPGATSGKYVNAITVDANGNIKITYQGPQASSKLSVAATDTLYIQPGADANGDIVWVCGTAAVPTNVTLSTAAVTTVPVAYLPAACHL
jgi:type IV pilus assembly protein PilA